MAASVSFKGVFPILVTPFDEKENVDLESFARVVRFMADIGVDGVTILGVLGESNRLVDSEREELIKAAVEAARGRIPVVVGTSHKGTQGTLYLSLNPDVAIPLMIRKIRKELGLSQKEVAHRLHIAYQSYQAWENPNIANPTLKQLSKLAGAVGKNASQS